MARDVCEQIVSFNLYVLLQFILHDVVGRCRRQARAGSRDIQGSDFFFHNFDPRIFKNIIPGFLRFLKAHGMAMP